MKQRLVLLSGLLPFLLLFAVVAPHTASLAQEVTATPTPAATVDPLPSTTPIPTLSIPVQGTPVPTATPNALMIFDLLPEIGVLPAEVPQFTTIVTSERTLSVDDWSAGLQSEFPEQEALIVALIERYRAAGVIGTHQRLLLAEDCAGFAIFGIGTELFLLPGTGSAQALVDDPVLPELYSSIFGWQPDADHNLPGNLYTGPVQTLPCDTASTRYVLDYAFGPVVVSLQIFAPNLTERETVLSAFMPFIETINARIATRLGFPQESFGSTDTSADDDDITTTDTSTTPADGQFAAPACENGFSVPMVSIPQTTFFMGLRDDQPGPPDERPGREVTVDAFCIDVFEVTNARYIGCVNDGSCTPPGRTDSTLVDDYYQNPAYSNFPVLHVTWQQAQDYCAYRGGRLPTEAEWELVARYDLMTDTMRSYPWGNQSPNGDRVNGMMRDVGDVVEVGQHPEGVSSYGVFDLSGNAAEWVQDWYGPYSRSETDNPTGPAEGTQRVVRGGAFDSTADALRGGARGTQSPVVASSAISFRCIIPQD